MLVDYEKEKTGLGRGVERGAPEEVPGQGSTRHCLLFLPVPGLRSGSLEQMLTVMINLFASAFPLRGCRTRVQEWKQMACPAVVGTELQCHWWGRGGR